MSQSQPKTETIVITGASNKELIATVAVATTTVIVTVGALRTAADLMKPPIRRLTRKLEKKSEELKKSNQK